MGYLEVLPKNCPPVDAHDNGCGKAYRFVMSDKPEVSDFASHAAKGLALTCGIDPCKWSSCSLFPSMEVIQKKRKLPGLRKYQYVATLDIGPGCGKACIGKNHIDFWMFDSFDPLSAILTVTAL